VVSVPAALIALYVVHWLTIRRQRRDERFKLRQAACDLLNEIGETASEAWRKPGSDPDAQTAAFETVGKIGRLGRGLEMLRGRDSKFDFGRQLIAFRRAVTTDLDDAIRSPNLERAGEVQATAGDPEDAIDRTLRRPYGWAARQGPPWRVTSAHARVGVA
jgi:hypothetical protein